MVFVLGAGAAIRAFRSRNTVKGSRILAWEGVLQSVEPPDSEESRTGRITIGRRVFELDHEVLDLLFLGLVYRMYYLAESEKSVAIEALSVDPLDM